MSNQEILEKTIQIGEYMKKPWWHVMYWAKWHFIVKPRLIRELNLARAKILDELLTSDILRLRIK